MKTEEPRAMREIHEIRDKMREESKDMSKQEFIKYIKDKSDEFERRAGITLPRLTKRV